MAGWGGTLARAFVSGTAASVASSVALAAVARAEGAGALQPVNATSHWLNGDRAGRFMGADLAHTAVGYATHHAACVFWAVLFERWQGDARSGGRGPGALPVVGRALATSVIAAAVDYGATPKRFTPGWELVLTKRSMAGVYGAMAAGLAAAALIRAGNRDR